MGLPQLESCCFVFDLKTGNIIMGCINAVLSFILMIIMIVVAVMLAPIESAAVNDSTMSDDVKEATLNARAAAVGVYAMSIILVLMFLIKFCFDVLFVYGVVTERAGIIRAYFIMWTVFFLLSMFTFFLNIQHYSAGHIFMELVYISLNVYAILLSHSFYRLLNSREEV